MTTIECPWCDEQVELDLPAAVELTCVGCNVTVELAADSHPAIAQAA